MEITHAALADYLASLQSRQASHQRVFLSDIIVDITMLREYLENTRLITIDGAREVLGLATGKEGTQYVRDWGCITDHARRAITVLAGRF